jgi:hypothetical protein
VDETSPNASEAIRALSRLDTSAQSDGVLIFTKPRPGSPNLFRLLPTGALSQRFLSIDSQHAKDWSKRPVVDYVPGRQVPDGHLMHVAASEVPLLVSLGLDDVGSQTIPLFKPSSPEVGRLRMTITLVSQDSLKAAFFRFMRPTARLARSGLVAAIFRDPAFDTLDDDVLFFNEAIDAISTGGRIFFTNRSNFDRTFEFLALLHAKAVEIFDTVTGGLKIEGLVELRTAATTDINMISKLGSIQRKISIHPEYLKALHMDRLLAFIDNNPHVDVDLAGDGATRRLVFLPNPQRRWKILKLLDDDYLRSDLTTMEYEVDSKGDPLG